MSKLVLLVEDNPSDEKLTLRALKSGNFGNEVSVARDGAEALAYLFPADAGGRARAPLPTVVLLDLKLPRVDGLEVLRRIRENEATRLLPVVILTSSGEDEDMLRSYALGANAYVRKPVDFVAFMEATRTLGLFWLLVNEQPPPRGNP